MEARTLGLRNRYQIACGPGGRRQLSPAGAGRRVFGPVAPGPDGDGLLGNGGRLQLEEPSRPEYGTPACGDARDLVVHDKAGERIIEGLLADAVRQLREEGVASDISVFKGTAGSADESYGSQETYLVGRRGDFGRLASLLIPFLVTRQLICGPGAVQPTPGGAVYCLSRPAGTPGLGMSGRAARSRPLISTRNEPRPAEWRRLRVNVSDPNMSETTTLLKAGSTDLVLRMIEAGHALPSLTLDQPAHALTEASRDLTGRHPLRLADGRTRSALDIQRDYLSQARDFTTRQPPDTPSRQVLNAIDRQVLDLWQRTPDAIASGNLGVIAQEIDWVIKYQLIERYRAAHHLPLSAPQIAAADLAYHDITRRHGLYYQLQRTGEATRTTRDLDIFAAKTRHPHPPPTHCRQAS